MIKLLFSCLLFCCILLGACKGQIEETPDKCYKGRLSLKGICNNYVIELVEGSIDTSKVELIWKNPETGKTYKNAFALTNKCALPTNLKEGDEFLFQIDATQTSAGCVTCSAFSPTPKKSLPISICP